MSRGPRSRTTRTMVASEQTDRKMSGQNPFSVALCGSIISRRRVAYSYLAYRYLADDQLTESVPSMWLQSAELLINSDNRMKVIILAHKEKPESVIPLL